MGILLQPTELKTNQSYKGLIYGQPGVGKTTLALSSSNPVCIDFDKGMKRVEPQFQVPSLQVDKYEQVLELLNSKELNSFDTLVIDTLGKLVDRISDYVMANNFKAKAGASLSRQGWGEVKGVFNNLLRSLESKNKSIIFVAHESEEKDKDNVVKRPDCSGSARKDIVKELDFMGYVKIRGNSRTISFAPSEEYYAKNSLGLNSFIEIPNTKNGNNFIAKQIEGQIAVKAKERSEMRKGYEELKSLIDSNILDLQNVDDVNTYYKNMGDKTHIWDSAIYEKLQLSERVKKLNISFNKEKKLFEENQAKKE